MEAAIRDSAKASAAAHRCTTEFSYDRRYPATVNHPEPTRRAIAAAALVVGDDAIEREPTPSMGSEDFAFMLQARPGCYVWLGSGSSEGGCILHNPRYDFNDAILPIGASYWVRLVETELTADTAQADLQPGGRRSASA